MNVLTVSRVNPGASIQDLGRPGWKRFGIPPGGSMDAASARWANLLVGNHESAPVIELLFGSASFLAIHSVTLALTGAESSAGFPHWRSFTLHAGEELVLGRPRTGLWTYLAIAGGFHAPLYFNSASVNERAGLGSSLSVGDELQVGDHVSEHAIAGRFLTHQDQPSFVGTAILPVRKGPEWDFLPASSREQFLATEWHISSRSDRAGYRLDGPVLNTSGVDILSAPVPLGTIQSPAHGQPIVLMRDGPTVGGYPRLAILETAAVSRFAQCAPGCSVRFEVID